MTFKAAENQMKSNIYKFLQTPAFTGVTSDQKVHAIKTFKAIENQTKGKVYKFLPPPPFNGIKSDQKVNFKVI